MLGLGAGLWLCLSATASFAAEPQTNERVVRRGTKLTPMGFPELEGWASDDHLAALKAFLISCDRVLFLSKERANSGRPPPSAALVQACQNAKKLSPGVDREGARAFFEANFSPFAVVHRGKPGLLTGYYEPVLEGSRTQQGRFQVPIYKRPPELVTLIEETKGGKAGTMTHGRRTEKGVEAYFSRAEIEQGALKGRNLELAYLADPIDAFFMQIQGSARIQLSDGTQMRVGYDGKNGHPYASIGRRLIELGVLTAEQVSLSSLRAWLGADRERGRQAMWHNPSYIFFREMGDSNDGGPLGALGAPLSPGRSIAIDPGYHPLGTPIFVTAHGMGHVEKSGTFSRLMIAQDVGSAIKGPERGDLYFGTGEAAGKLAGVTRHKGHFAVLVPNSVPASADASGPKP
jgi:membrane-bound lytic murein transglycosylase A